VRFQPLHQASFIINRVNSYFFARSQKNYFTGDFVTVLAVIIENCISKQKTSLNNNKQFAS
jgi:hypothetical protein